MTLRVVSVSLLALALGCGHKMDAAECRIEAHDLQQLLQKTDHDPSPIRGRIDLVSRPELPKLGGDVGSVIQIILDVAADGMLLTPDNTRERFERALANNTRRGRDAIVFEVDAVARWDLVVSTVNAATSAGFDQISFVFAGRVPVTAPPVRSKIDDELDAIMSDANANNRATELAQVITRVAKSCPAMTEVFRSVASEASPDKGSELIAALGPALVECNCSLDMPAFRSVMWRMLIETRPASFLTVRVSTDGTPIELAASTPWREASKLFTPSTKTIVLRVAP